MLANFDFSQKSHLVTNMKKFLPTLQKFKYYLIDKQNPNHQLINEHKTDKKVVIVSLFEYKDQSLLQKYFTICFDKIILISKDENLHLIQPFFINNNESTFYFINNSKDSFDKIIQSVLIKKSDKDEDLKSAFDLFRDEFTKLENELFIRNSESKELDLFIKLIKRPISAYLIRRSYLKLKKPLNSVLLPGTENNKYISFNKGDFLQLRNLGGNAFLIYHIRHNRLFVIKKYVKDNSKSSNLYYREIRNYKEFNNFPFIPKFYKNFDEQDEHCIIMDFIYGTKLNEYHDNIDNHKIDWITGEKQVLDQNEKIKIIFQLIIAFAYLHNNGFIYRDLKPDNIIIDSNKSLYLIDFDELIKVDEANDPNRSRDFYCIYVDLQEVNENQPSFASDIYSIGLIISHIAKIEYKNKIGFNFLQNLSNFEPIKGHNKIFKDICEKCTSNIVSKRPQINDLIKDFYYNIWLDVYLNGATSSPLSELKTIESNKQIYTAKFNKYWIALVGGNDPVSMLYLGSLYYHGELLPKNLKKAFLYLNKSFLNPFIRKDRDPIPQRHEFIIDTAVKYYNYGSLYRQNDIDDNNMPFLILPRDFKLKIQQIQDEKIAKIYSQIKFLYFSYSIFDQDENSSSKEVRNYFEDYLLYILSEQKFITCQILEKKSEKDNYAVFCLEAKCLIIKGINKSFYNELIKKLQISVINISSDLNNECLTEKEAKVEVQNFCNEFEKEISDNEFVSFTISPIVCFLIRRNFYPLKYFQNPSFFCFAQTKEFQIQKYTNDILSTNNSFSIDAKYSQLVQNSETDEKETFLFQFKKEDFITLRTIYSSQKALYNLVIHTGNLHIFMMKILIEPIDEARKINNRSFVPYYGFITEDNKVKALICKFMSNGTLESFGQTKTPITALMTIKRISEGIEYLQNNSLVHKELNPSNILIDNNFVPYISGLESICQSKDIIQNIHSFRSILSFFYGIKQDKQNDILADGPQSFQNLYKFCKEADKTDLQVLKLIIDGEIYNFDYVNQYLTMNINDIDIIQLTIFLTENLINLKNNYEELHNYLRNILIFALNFGNVIEVDKVLVLNSIAFKYNTGFVFPKNIYESIKYYELAIQFNDSSAFNNLGELYKAIGMPMTAYEHFKKSAELFNSKALENIGDYFYEENDTGKALEFYQLSVNNGNPDALKKIGDMYESGIGVDKNFKKALEYYHLYSLYKDVSHRFQLQNKIKEKLTQFDQDPTLTSLTNSAIESSDSNTLYFLGYMYEKGIFCEKSNKKAIELYHKSANLDNSSALYNLGVIYRDGNRVVKDINRAEQYFIKASNFNNSDAYYALAELYSSEKKNYKEIIYYYKLAADSIDPSYALYSLGIIYYKGEIVQKNYSKALNYLKRSSLYGNSMAILILGLIYYNGNGVQKDYSKAMEYFEKSAELKNPITLFYLGNFYSEGDSYIFNLSMAIDCYLKAIEYKNNIYEKYYYYQSLNELGMIYIIYLKKLDDGEKYLTDSANEEYPLAQNNFGLFNQFFKENKNEAEYRYRKSSKTKFSLAEYNLGYLFEKENKIDESIQFYIQASNHLNEHIIFRGVTFNDRRLEISKLFIICLTNLKLVDYFFSFENLKEAKKYFIKAFGILKDENNCPKYKFRFHFKVFQTQDEYQSDHFYYLRQFILNFPPFNLINQPFLDLKTYSNIFQFKDSESGNENDSNSQDNDHENDSNSQDDDHENDSNSQDSDNEKKFFIDEDKFKFQKDDNKSNRNDDSNDPDDSSDQNDLYNSDDINEITFNDSGKLFDFIINDSNAYVKTIFISEIKEIINIMNVILYTPPYMILFGRISLIKPHQKDADENFFDGFNI